MNDLIAFLNRHPRIQNVVAVLPNENKDKFVNKFIKKTALKKITFLDCDNEEKNKKMDITKFYVGDGTDVTINILSLNEFKGMQEEWTLCIKNAEASFIEQFAKYKPTYLLCSIEEGTMSSFHIWEQYRANTKHMFIKTKRKNIEPQILEWEKNPDSDIELSVIFPMYNVASYLDQCISSVTAWDAPYVEFLFVNDGSPDNSRDIVLKYAEKDNRIKLIDKENGGCASARQLGLENAKGTYVGFVDPDDFVDESMFRKLLRAAIVGSYDISYCGYNEYYENTKTVKRVQDLLGYPWCNGVHIAFDIWQMIAFMRVAIWRGIYRKQFLDKNNIHFYTDLKRFDDLPFKVETLAFAKSVIAVPEHLYYYRLSRPGQDVSADDERLYVHFDIFKYLNESVASKKDLFLTDRLEMCKIDTHLFALGKIKKEFVATYLKNAKEDLLSTADFNRFYSVAEVNMGKEKAELYKKMIEEDVAYFSEKK